jgi:hypothetical protein
MFLMSLIGQMSPLGILLLLLGSDEDEEEDSDGSRHWMKMKKCTKNVRVKCVAAGILPVLDGIWQ